MPINGANHKYKSLYKITILTFICLPGPVCVCARVRACVCEWGRTEMCEVESYWFPFFMSLNHYKKE